MQKIVTFLTFQDNAEEAVEFYISIFNNSRIIKKNVLEDAGPGGQLLSIIFELEGKEYIAINGGPSFQFTPAISLLVNCDTQDEIDELWEKFKVDGKEMGPGWIQDRFGLSWQIAPSMLSEYITDPDEEKSQRVMQAMLQMTKMDIEKLKQAYEGK